MDLKKIGRYMAEKRKALGLTQRQVAARLNMSDKSVSKWERDVCLPDVSVYQDLCEILGISINEFLAGEDIAAEALPRRADETLMQVSEDSRDKQRILRMAVTALGAALLLVALAAVCAFAYVNRPQNHIAPADPLSAEAQTADLLAGPDGAYLLRFAATDPFLALTLTVTEYRSGKAVASSPMELGFDGIESPKQGVIAFIPDYDTRKIHVIAAGGGSKARGSIPILEDAAQETGFGRSLVGLSDETPITYGEQQSVVAFICDQDELRTGSVEDYDQGTPPIENDYAYCLSVTFEK